MSIDDFAAMWIYLYSENPTPFGVFMWRHKDNVLLTGTTTMEIGG